MHPVRKRDADLPDTIRHLPDDVLVPGRLVKEWWATLHHAEPEIVTTAWLSENVGLSQEWWADRARDGRIPGAFQDSPGSPWYLPLRAARDYLLRVQQRKDRNLGVARGPYRRAS